MSAPRRYPLSTDWLTRKEAADYCRVHVHTIDRWRRQGLEGGGSRGRRLYQRRTLDAWLLQLADGHPHEE